MKNIALCFSGGIRYFNSCFPSIYKYFIHPLIQKNNNVDIFLHLTYIDKIDENIKVKFKMIKSTFDLKILLEKVKPKKYEIYEFNNNIQINEMKLDKDYYNYDWGSEKNQNYAFSAFGMYSKINKCNLLRKIYQEENNIQYDFVWRGRLDYIFYDYIDLEMIDNTEENNIYLIKDRYAHNTKKELNDKFFGAKPEIMDNICQIYYELPIYLEKFKKENIFFDGQFLIYHKIKDLIKAKIANEVKMIGHRNTYCKCQCRHSIQLKNKNIFISIDDRIINYELSYKFLYDGYNVYSDIFDKKLSFFENYYFTDFSNIQFEKFIFSDTNKYIKQNNCKFIILDNLDNYPRKDYNDKFIYIYYKNKLFKRLYNILYHTINSKKLKKINRFLKLNFEPKLFEKVYYYVPDRGKILGKIIEIKKHHARETKYRVEDNNNYFRNEIEIINYSKRFV